MSCVLSVLLVLQSGSEPAAQSSAASRAASRPALPQLPVGRYEHQAIALGKLIYVIGGQAEGGAPLARVDAFDPAAGSWTEKAPMQVPRSFFAAAEVGGRIYAVCGTRLDSMECYDPAADRWTMRAPIPVGRTHLDAVGLAGKLWVIGGHGELVDGRSFTDRVDVYDPGTDRWSEGPRLPRALHGHRAVVLADELHVLGGAGEDFVEQRGHWVLRSGKWEPRALLLGGHLFFGAEAIAGRIQVIGKEVGTWDRATDQWSSGAPSPQVLYHFDTAALAGVIYAFGGVRTEGTGPLSLRHVLAYDVAAGRWR